MKRLFLFAIVCLVAAALPAQSRKAYERAGDAAFKEKNFGAAFQYYGTVLTKDPDNYRLWWKYG